MIEIIINFLIFYLVRTDSSKQKSFTPKGIFNKRFKLIFSGDFAVTSISEKIFFEI